MVNWHLTRKGEGEEKIESYNNILVWWYGIFVFHCDCIWLVFATLLVDLYFYTAPQELYVPVVLLMGCYISLDSIALLELWM